MGILGGTFDPVHNAHLAIAATAMQTLGLDKILWIPTGKPGYRKPPVASVYDRLAMLALAIKGEPDYEIDRRELEANASPYTVDTLTELRERHPEDDLIFIAGGDMAASLPTWREPERVLELAAFAVAERRGAVREDVVERWRSLGTGPPREPLFLDMPRVDVSSSEVRRRVREGRPVRYLVPDAVAEYIASRGLYRSAVTSS